MQVGFRVVMEEVEGEQTGSDGVGSGGRQKRKEERSYHDTLAGD